VLIEKLQLSIGIESADGQIVKIIERNTPIPITKTRSFTTEDSNQKSVDISVFQGESIFKEGCVFIGKFTLVNLPPNKPVIFVSIRVDSNGIISVSARDKRGFTESGIQIETSSSKLSEEIITDLLVKYEQTKGSETQYKKLISNYYQLITLVDKISYQINFRVDLNLESEVIQTIRFDLEKVLGAMSNPYIVYRYRINTNLLSKCAIINDISSGLVPYDTTFEMSSEEITNYIDMLIKLREYLTDRYDIFIIQDEKNDMIIISISKFV
jgi:molecular chaperone DnaK (HSP70)